MKLVLRIAVVGTLLVSAIAALAQHKITIGGITFSPIFSLMQHPEIQKELGLTPAQKKQISAAAGESVSADGDRVELRISGDMDIDDIDAKSLKVLDAKQKTRMFEIYSQVHGLAALSHPAIADWIGLSDKTRKKLEAIVEDQQQAMMDLAMSNGGRIDSREDGGEMARIRKKAETQIKGILTPAELKTWESKQGKKWNGKIGFGM